MKSKLIVHCSDSTFGNAVLIDQWHKERGFNNKGYHIGYHWVILNGISSYKAKYKSFLDGVIESGRPAHMNGAHCKYHNKGYYGVCLIGKDRFTEEQYMSLSQMCFELDIKSQDIFPHNHFDKTKTCPNFDLSWWKQQYYV